MNKKILILTWLIAGYALWGLGFDLFALVPQFRLEIFWRSLRSIAFLTYLLIAVVIWVSAFFYLMDIRRPSLQTLWVVVGRLQSGVLRTPKWIRWIVAAALCFIPPYLLLFSPFAFEPIGLFLKFFILLTPALFVSLIVDTPLLLRTWYHKLIYSIIMVAVVFFAGSYLTGVSSYPFSIGWSEGNRLWDYSVRFGSDRYLVPEGEEIFAFISPGRELLMGLPYLIPNISILGVRLLVSMTQMLAPFVLGAVLIFGNKTLKNGWKDGLLFSGWAYLFLLQGPIQARLIMSAIIMVLGVRSRNLLVAVILIIFAGYYANISRWSWLYAPGLWAGLLALLQENAPSLRRADWGKLKRPISLGLAGYFGGQILGMLIPITNNTVVDSGASSLFGSFANQTAFSQAFLWDRLLPNPTFSPGILFALMLAVIPSAIWLLLSWKYTGWRLNRLQILGAAFPVAAFLAVGLIASTKIGGGADLHNMDMFLIAILLLVSTAWPKTLVFLREAGKPVLPRMVGYMVLVAPIFMIIGSTGPLILPPEENEAATLRAIQDEVAIAKENGEVLFIDQRQLLTFGYIQGVTLVSDYEKKLLIDKAMANQTAYFESFYEDLENHRFSLIISEPLFLAKGDPDKPFPEENDVWVEWVSEYLLKYYRVLLDFKAVGIQLLVPREQ